MVERVAMLSTHGYFDPVPELGKTDTGGQVVYVLRLAKALAHLGVKVDIYTRWFDPERPQIDPLPDCEDVRVIRMRAGPWEFIPKERIYGVLPELAQNMIEFMGAKGLRYDAFHGHYVDAGIVTLDVARTFSSPAFFTAHSWGALKRQMFNGKGDPEELERTFNFSLRIAEETRILRSVVAQVVTTKEEVGIIERLYGVQPPRLEFIPPGVDIKMFHPLGNDEQETPVPLLTPYLFAAGRIAATKGYDLLVPAFARVLHEFPDMHLVIAGGSAREPDPEEISVRRWIDQFTEKYGISSHVHMIGPVDHRALPSYYRQAEMLILPSRRDSFGMTATEGMACEIPVVISQFAGVHENFTHGQDCLVVNPIETEQFAQTIMWLLRNPQSAKKMARAGREHTCGEFSWNAVAGRSLALYDRASVTVP